MFFNGESWRLLIRAQLNIQNLSIHSFKDARTRLEAFLGLKHTKSQSAHQEVKIRLSLFLNPSWYTCRSFSCDDSELNISWFRAKMRENEGFEVSCSWWNLLDLCLICCCLMNWLLFIDACWWIYTVQFLIFISGAFHFFWKITFEDDDDHHAVLHFWRISCGFSCSIHSVSCAFSCGSWELPADYGCMGVGLKACVSKVQVIYKFATASLIISLIQFLFQYLFHFGMAS